MHAAVALDLTHLHCVFLHHGDCVEFLEREAEFAEESEWLAELSAQGLLGVFLTQADHFHACLVSGSHNVGGD